MRPMALAVVLVLMGAPAGAQNAGTALDTVSTEYGTWYSTQVFRLQSTSFPFPFASPAFELNGRPHDIVQPRGADGLLFAERAATNGRGRVSVAVREQSLHWRTLDGYKLQDNLAPLMYCGETIPYCPLLTIDATTSILGFVGAYGITDRLEVGATASFVRASVRALSGKVWIPGGMPLSDRSSPNPPALLSPPQVGDGHSMGLGDVVARSKYRFWSDQHLAFAAGGELRFPTGHRDSLLGVGTLQKKLLFMQSSTIGRVSSHTNVSFTWAGKGFEHLVRYQDPDGRSGVYYTPLLAPQPSNEFNYVVGAYVTIKRAALGGELMGRRLSNTAGLARGGTITVFFPDFPVPRSRVAPTSRPYTVQQRYAIAGATIHVTRATRLAAHVMWPLTDGGLTPSPALTVGLQAAR